MDLEFLTSVLMIVGIDVVLGGDNAIVIALASRNLPEPKRNKAILIGTILAIVLRILLTILAVYLLDIPFLQLIGGILLTLIAVNLLTDNNNDLSSIQGKQLYSKLCVQLYSRISLWGLIMLSPLQVQLTEILLVIIGLLISIPIIIWGSKLILILMERFPFLIYCGAAILSYTAGKMVTHEDRLATFFIKPKFHHKHSLLIHFHCSMHRYYRSTSSITECETLKTFYYIIGRRFSYYYN